MQSEALCLISMVLIKTKKQIAKVSKISSHVARRTFCTENYRRRQDCEELRRATGHRTYFGYSKYLCYDGR